jgi:hypothetical protein
MAEKSTLTRRLVLFMAACFWFSTPSPAAAEDRRDLLVANRTTKLDHGMYEIREAGREFLAKERRK